MRMNYKIYNKLSLLEKREFVNTRLDNEYIISEEFEENNGDLKAEIEVTHKVCGCEDFVSLKELFYRKRKCPECFRNEREENFREFIKERFEPKSRYYGVYGPVKVLIKKCGHTVKVKPYSVLNAVKNGTNIDCEECKLENKINTIKKHLNIVSTFEGEFEFISIKDNNNVSVLHKRCNQLLNFKYKNIIDHDVNCKKCKKEDKEISFEHKLRHKYKVSKDFTLYRKYVDCYTPVYLQHKCGYIKKLTITSLELLDEIKCNVCDLDQFTNAKELNTILYKYTKGEFVAAKEIDKESEEVFLRRKKCGHVFFTNAKQFFKNPCCPKCKEEEELSKRHINFKKNLYKKYGSEYEIATQYKTYTSSVELIHTTCGTVFTDIPARVLKKKTKEPCPVCNKLKLKSTENRKTRHLTTLYEKYKDEYSLSGEYIDSRTETTYYHNKCGSHFNASPLQMVKRRHPCDKCKNGILLPQEEISKNENISEENIDTVLETCE